MALVMMTMKTTTGDEYAYKDEYDDHDGDGSNGDGDEDERAYYDVDDEAVVQH